MFDCNPGTGTSNVTNAGMNDIFFARYSQRIDIGVKELIDEEVITVFPNPNNGNFSLQTKFEDNFDVTIYNAIGQIVKEGANLSGINKIDLSGSKGIYNIVVKANDNYKTIKVVIE
ncbi:MAG: T9SS type A sorting domain-containing protein [Sphingobacteriaceae bacterium]|nr:T9SS type A sorting domain-containing protein [Sphingobacteriaceae bacterium]